MIKYLYLVVFIILTTLHLIGSYRNQKPLRDVTKGFILFSLLGFYLWSTKEHSYFIIFAILFSWLGDLLLIPHGVKWFTAGGIAFMISHILFVLSYNETMDITTVSPVFIILIALLFVAIVSIIFSRLRKYLPKPLFYPMFLYLLINGTMNCFALYRLIANFQLNSIITVIGAILFFISDSSLFFVRFKKNSIQKSHFWVMITYSIGEFLIILGLIL